MSKALASHDGPVVIGLTGPIASGKSTVASMLADLGAEHIDADLVYHTLVASGSPLWRAVVKRFGDTVVQPDGELDRRELGSIVFKDPAALADLERITHPPVTGEIRSIVSASSAPAVVVEAIKLVQAGLLNDLDQLWLVVAEPEVRSERLMRRGGFDRGTAMARIAASSEPLPAGVHPDVIIDNSGTLEATRQLVSSAWERVMTQTADGETRQYQHQRENQ